MDRGFGPHRHRQRLTGKENGLVAARPSDGFTKSHKSSMPVYAATSALVLHAGRGRACTGEGKITWNSQCLFSCC